MSEENYKIGMDAGLTPQGETNLKAVQDRVRRLNAEVEEFERKAMRASMRGLGALSATVGLFQTIGSYFPSALTPIFNAAMSAIGTTVAAMVAIGSAYAATGVLAPLTAVVYGAAIGLSIVGFFEVLKGQLNMKTEIDKMSGLVRQMGTAISAWGRFAGSLTD
jgi:hypothetical protein